VKDRAALSMIEDGERTGALHAPQDDHRLNVGQYGDRLRACRRGEGYRVKLVMPGNVSAERKALVAAYGAEIVYSEAGEGSDGAILMVRELRRDGPRQILLSRPVFEPGQPSGPLRGHAVEILAQTSGRITHFIAGLGTTGTFVGTSRRLKEHDPSIRHHRRPTRRLISRARGTQAHSHVHRSEDLGSEPGR